MDFKARKRFKKGEWNIKSKVMRGFKGLRRELQELGRCSKVLQRGVSEGFRCFTGGFRGFSEAFQGV